MCPFPVPCCGVTGPARRWLTYFTSRASFWVSDVKCSDSGRLVSGWDEISCRHNVHVWCMVEVRRNLLVDESPTPFGGTAAWRTWDWPLPLYTTFRKSFETSEVTSELRRNSSVGNGTQHRCFPPAHALVYVNSCRPAILRTSPADRETEQLTVS